MSERGFTVRALGEIAIRCIDLDAMVAFYRDVIGLEPINDPDNGRIVFLRIADGFEGHTAVPALFRHYIAGAGRGHQHLHRDYIADIGRDGVAHHIALSLPWDEQQAVIEWYENLGQEYYVETFDWVGWRGVFTFDPDGNTVELVAKDPNWVAS